MYHFFAFVFIVYPLLIYFFANDDFSLDDCSFTRYSTKTDTIKRTYSNNKEQEHSSVKLSKNQFSYVYVDYLLLSKIPPQTTYC